MTSRRVEAARRAPLAPRRLTRPPPAACLFLTAPPARPPSSLPRAQEIFAFLLSPEARDLRPLLTSWLSNGLDLFARDRARKAYASLATFAPRLPFIGALPTPPAPPVFVPGLGFVGAEELVNKVAPALDQSEGIYLQVRRAGGPALRARQAPLRWLALWGGPDRGGAPQAELRWLALQRARAARPTRPAFLRPPAFAQSLTELACGLLGLEKADLESPSWSTVNRLLLSPNEQARELQQSLSVLAGSGASAAAVSGGAGLWLIAA